MTYPTDSIYNSEQGPQDGLTKREYFAAMAMQAILTTGKYGGFNERIANDAVKAADALIAALNIIPNETY